ncbi:MAG: bifunctional riboflavin kinase/FAD synthetase [Clostridia bacterium]|nr:bifunctional riboflavin kinase/FAD synthetase [Clostridia bacterium]
MIRPTPAEMPRILSFAAGPPFETPSVMTIGVFDGVHVGHRALIERTCERAARAGARAIALAFETPAFKDALPVDALDRRLRELGRAGIELVCLCRFEDVRDLSPAAFVDRLLARCRPTAVVVGYDFRFGRGACGDAEELARLLAPAGVPVEILPPVCVDGVPVSSSLVREALSAGDPARAARLLGRPFCLSGVTVHGKELGRRLGCPTLNLPLDEGLLIPRHGVYRCVCGTPTGRYPAVCNVGVRPTVEADGAPNCEIHLLPDDVPALPAGVRVEVELLDFLRPERAFGSEEELARRLALDVGAAKAAFLTEQKKESETT